jgi:hypothetical protein
MSEARRRERERLTASSVETSAVAPAVSLLSISNVRYVIFSLLLLTPFGADVIPVNFCGLLCCPSVGGDIHKMTELRKMSTFFKLLKYMRFSKNSKFDEKIVVKKTKKLAFKT